MFHTVPGKTTELENQLRALRDLVRQAGGDNPRILHAHFASPEAPDVVFVQDAPDMATLEKQIPRSRPIRYFRNGLRRSRPC